MAENFELPSPNDFELICKVLKLNSKQRNELKKVIRRTHEQVDSIVRSNIGSAARKRVIDGLGMLDVALQELLGALAIKSQDIPFFAQGDIRGQVNVGASGRLTQSIAGRRVAPAVRGSHHSSPAFDTLFFVPQVVALKNELDLLRKQVTTDRGGPNQDLARTYLIVALIKAESRILGSVATGTEDGPFLNLVSNVFGICGLKEKGLKSLVQRTLRAVRKVG